jgi:hypothetical protein
MAEQSPESPMVSVSSETSPETPFQNEHSLSPSTTNSPEVVERDSSLGNMFDGLHSVETQFDQFLHSPYFTASNEVRRNSQGSNSVYDTESLKEELDAALLASPASIANKRRVGPVMVETVDEDSCHQSYSHVNLGPEGRPSAEDLMHSPNFTASNEVRRNSQGSNSIDDTESLKEELDAALLASPASIANTRRGGPLLVETVNEDSCHQPYSQGNLGPEGRPSAENMMPLFPAPASAPPPPPPSSVGSSSTAPFPAAAAPDLRPPNAKLTTVSQDSESDDSESDDSESHDSSQFINYGSSEELDNRIASLRKGSYYTKSNNVEPRRSSAYDPHVDSLRRELDGAALDAPSVVDNESELAPLDEYWSSEEDSVIVPQEDDAMARKYTIAAAVLVGCNCFLSIWILAMIIVLASRD